MATADVALAAGPATLTVPTGAEEPSVNLGNCELLSQGAEAVRR